jgi:hypothetical protein
MKKKLFRKVKKIAEKEGSNKKNFLPILITKMNEELGELSEVHLEDIGYKAVNSRRSDEELRTHRLEETVDVHLMSYHLLVNNGYTEEEISEMIDLKMKKWIKKSEKRKNFNI